jgi:hypothetical protein
MYTGGGGAVLGAELPDVPPAAAAGGLMAAQPCFAAVEWRGGGEGKGLVVQQHVEACVPPAGWAPH